MSEMNPKTEKGSEYGGTGQFRRRQTNSRNFTRKKENPVGRCKNIKNDVFDLVLQGQTEILTNPLKYFYYISGIKFKTNGSDVQYAIKNISNPTLSAPTHPAFKVGKTALTMVQTGILDAKIKIL